MALRRGRRSAEVISEAVAAVQSGQALTKVAAEYAVTEQTLQKWVTG